MISRRFFIAGAAAVAAPAIIRPGLLMPVKRYWYEVDDGVSLLSAAHPYALGEVVADLSERSLLTLLEHVYREAKTPLRLRPTHLVIRDPASSL